MVEKKVITAKTAKAMREDRQAGMTIRAIMVKYDVSAHTVARHTSEASAEAMRRYEKARYERMKADPEKMAKRREQWKAAEKRRAQKENRKPKHFIPDWKRKAIAKAVQDGMPVKRVAAAYDVSLGSVQRHGCGYDPRKGRARSV